jgi:2-dehydro-3-deoxygluconokinase
VKQVAKTFRFDRGEGGIQYYTAFYTRGGDGNRLYSSREYFSDKIVDKVGSGDCFMAGLIRGLLLGQSIQETLEFATAAAFQKLFIPSDATDQREGDIQKIVDHHE